MGQVLKVSIEDKYKEAGDESTIYVDYLNIVKLLKPGDLIYVDDGLISLKVTENFPTHLVTGLWMWGRVGGWSLEGSFFCGIACLDTFMIYPTPLRICFF